MAGARHKQRDGEHLFGDTLPDGPSDAACVPRVDVIEKYEHYVAGRERGGAFKVSVRLIHLARLESLAQKHYAQWHEAQ